MSETKEIYEELAGILHEYDPNLIILKSLREGEDDPDVDSDVDVYCIIRQRKSNNLHIAQGTTLYGGSTETSHGVRTFQNKRVVIQFDFYGKDEYSAEDMALACNAMLSERLTASPEAYSFSLLGEVGNVMNNSELAYGKRYKNRFSFKIELFRVYKLDLECKCIKMPEKLVLESGVVAK